MIFKCKICGGNLEVEENSTIATCQYCGNEQVIPKTYSEQKTKLYERANHFRANNEYDKAIALYESILNEDPTDCEIYWQIILCEYGVEYIKDKKTNKYLPTCNRTKTISVFANDNYKNAIKYSNNEQKNIYEHEAKKIDIIQKKAIEIANKEEPFDIFICYKETDENGKRTQDSVIAQDLYYQLEKLGYKVFFSRITLEGKLGIQYEPYIFAALNSAKIMIVIGTQKEHFNSVWVKNEWSRFLTLLKENKEKILIPAYKDMNPYDLPEEFAHLQAIDLGKIGVIEDLKNKIDTTIHKSNTKNNKTRVNIRKRPIKIIITILILIALSIIITTKYIIPETQYRNAEQLVSEKKYSEAINIYEKIKNYKDSKEKIFDCNNKIRENTKQELSKYIGKYDKCKNDIDELNGDEIPYGYVLEITDASTAGIEFNLTNYGHKVISMGARAKLDGNVYKFTFTDSWENKGKGELQLLEDGVCIDIDITEYIEYPVCNGMQEFKFSDMVKQ